MKSLILFCSLCFLLGSSLHAQAQGRDPRLIPTKKPQTQNLAANEQLTLPPFAIIEFQPGSSQLTEQTRKDLGALLRDAKPSDDMQLQAHIIGWSDKDVESSMNAIDQNLAKNRIESIEDLLSPDPTLQPIVLHDMTTPASWLVRRLTAREPELQSRFAMSSSSQLDRNGLYVVRTRGGPGRALVILQSVPATPQEPTQESP